MQNENKEYFTKDKIKKQTKKKIKYCDIKARIS